MTRLPWLFAPCTHPSLLLSRLQEAAVFRGKQAGKKQESKKGKEKERKHTALLELWYGVCNAEQRKANGIGDVHHVMLPQLSCLPSHCCMKGHESSDTGLLMSNCPPRGCCANWQAPWYRAISSYCRNVSAGRCIGSRAINLTPDSLLLCILPEKLALDHQKVLLILIEQQNSGRDYQKPNIPVWVVHVRNYLQYMHHPSWTCGLHHREQSIRDIDQTYCNTIGLPAACCLHSKVLSA